jgi:hypothetical protein
MTLKISMAAAVALAAIFVVPDASYAESHRHKGAAATETGYTNPKTCLGGSCTSENPDRVRQPCSGGSCFKRNRVSRHKSHVRSLHARSKQ